MDEMMGNEEVRESRWKDAWRWVVVMLAIAFVLVLTICVIFLYHVLKELFFIISSDLSALFGVILTMTLILISLAFLTEYLSMKFMITEISKQNHYLAVIRMEIDRIEDTEVLKKHKKELHKGYLPKADSVFVFFNYYFLQPIPRTFELGEEEEEEQSS